MNTIPKSFGKNNPKRVDMPLEIINVSSQKTET